MKLIIKYYKDLDLFGVGQDWLLFGNKKYKSHFGSSLSLILIGLLLAKIILMLLKIINNKASNINRSDTYDNDLHLNLSQFRYSICLDDFYTNNGLKMTSYYDIRTTLAILNNTGLFYEDLKGKFCDEFHDGEIPFPFDQSYFQTCYCMLGDERAYAKLDPYNYESVYIYTFLDNTNKAPLNETLTLSLYYIDYYFDYNTTLKNNPYLNTDFNRVFGWKYYYLNKLGFNDNSYNYFDLFVFEGHDNFTYYFSEKIVSSQTFEGERAYHMLFGFSSKKIFYTVTFMTVDDFMAIFGGTFQILLAFFSIVGKMFNCWLLNKELFLKTQEIQTNLFKDKIYQAFRRRSLLKNNFILHAINHRLSLNNQKEEIQLSTSSNNIVVESEKVSIHDMEIDKKKELGNFTPNDYKKIQRIKNTIFSEIIDFKNYINLYSQVDLMKKLMFGEVSYIQGFEKTSKMCYFGSNDNFNKEHTDPEFHTMPFYKRLEIFISEND
jgi:hypothetical protein